jgi:transposase
LPAGTDIIYVDECGVKGNMKRLYGRSPAGERVYLPVNGRREKKVNIVAGLRNGELLCPTKYSFNTNSQWFGEWFEWYLCPLLNDGSVVIMDNAAFHKKQDLNRIALSYGCRILWLPPYSPDKNPIEKSWANLKNWLRLNAKNYTDTNKAISAYIANFNSK